MRDGRLQQIGPPMEVYREPHNLFVASFIGSPAMNFLDVDLPAPDGALHCLRRSELSPAARGDAADGLASRPGGEGRRAILGIRPTDLTVGADRETAIGGGLSRRAVRPVTYVDVDVGGQRDQAVCDPDQAPASATGSASASRAARVRLFDPMTEARI